VVREIDANIVAAVLACAPAQGCDAIVLGRRGRGAPPRWARYPPAWCCLAAAPVIVINPAVQPVAARRLCILLAPDGSEAAQTLERARDIVERTGGMCALFPLVGGAFRMRSLCAKPIR
jgi:hypothetical protein